MSRARIKPADKALRILHCCVPLWRYENGKPRCLACGSQSSEAHARSCWYRGIEVQLLKLVPRRRAKRKA